MVAYLSNECFILLPNTREMMKHIDDIDFNPEREICAAKKNNDSNHFISYKVLPRCA